MSRGHSQPKHHFGRRVHERCKAKDSIEVIDVDKGEIDVVIIDETETSCQGSKGKTSGNNCYPGGVINIDDEEEGSNDAPKNLHDYAKNKVLHPRSSDSSTSEESESDECLMSATKFNIPFKMRMHFTACSSINSFGLSSDSGTNTSESDSSECDSWQSSESDTSDCEIMEDSSGNIREEWERAALRKKMSEKAHFGLEDQTSLSASSGYPGLLSEEGLQSKINVENCSSEDPDESSPIKENNEKETSSDMPVTPEFSNSHLKTRANTSIAEPSSSTNSHDEEAVSQKNEHNSGRSTGKDQFTDGIAGTVYIEKLLRHPCCRKTFSCSRQPWESEEAPDNVGLQEQKKKKIREPSSTTQSHCSFVVSPQIASPQNKEKPFLGETSIYNHERSEKSELSHGKSSCNSHAGSMLAEQSRIPPIHGDLISERERHKESDEYRQADEKEWAARQQQLRIQAKEVQRLKRKRKAESLRLLDMERRQKERVEEIRESEEKGKETENLKERFRAEVTKELFMLEHKYKDMASLLRGLGIPIAGGPYPTTHEVNVAYKRALLKFHPDRASKTNIRQQVEAEETFKLISRLKEELQF